MSNASQWGPSQGDAGTEDAKTNDKPNDSSPIDDEACAWVEHFARGRGRRADLAALKQWMARSPAHAESFDRVSQTWKALEPVGRTLQDRGVLARSARASPLVSPPVRMGRRAFVGGAIAATAAGAAAIAVSLSLDLWPSLSELTADVRTMPGERRQVMLADRVAIDLNTRTSVAFLAAGTGAHLISGEAMISSLAASLPAFELQASDGRVLAAGARFNVRNEGGSVCVACLAGKVRVEKESSAVDLPAGHQVLYSNLGLGPLSTVDPAAVSAWQDGFVIFESTPVAQVIAEVNRYRPGRIILTNAELGRRLFDARLRIEKIANVVRQIEMAFGARATELAGGIVLLG